MESAEQLGYEVRAGLGGMATIGGRAQSWEEAPLFLFRVTGVLGGDIGIPVAAEVMGLRSRKAMHTKAPGVTRLQNQSKVSRILVSLRLSF